MTYADKPFAPDSIWNRPLPPTAVLQTMSDPETSTFQRDCTFWGGDSVSLAYAGASDPMATWNYRSRGDLSGFWPFNNPNNWAGSVRVQTPVDIAAASAGGDRNVGLISADGRTYIEGWQYGFDAAKREHNVAVMTVHDLQGPGWPSLVGRKDIASLSTGIRAAGGPLLGGLLRGWEVAKMSIEHALAIILPVDKLKSLKTTAVGQRAGVQPTVVDGGSGYRLGQVLQLVGGAGRAAEMTVTQVGGNGAVVEVWPTCTGAYNPAPPATVQTRPLAGGAGQGCVVAVRLNGPGNPENGRVWPATNVDNTAGSYTGSIPMGSLWTLPPALDVATIGLTTPEAVACARAVQRYGAYVVDATVVGTQLMALTASDVTAEQWKAISGMTPFHAMTNMKVLGKQMVMVRNNVPA